MSIKNMIGIPYAFSKVCDGVLGKECPVCGAFISPDTSPNDSDNKNYLRHYESFHTQNETPGYPVSAQAMKEV